MKKKLLLSTIVIVGFVGYSFYSRHTTSQTTTVATKPRSSTPTASTTTPAPAPSTPATTTAYKDGIYTGSVVSELYGNVQVQATISGGKITDVQFLQEPNDQPNSQQVSAVSTPVLRQEAIQAQSAKVDTVTGATDTSQAFVTSLSVALASAKS